MTRILITGSRDLPDDGLVESIIAAHLSRIDWPSRVVIVHGACPTGADFYAERFYQRASVGTAFSRVEMVVTSEPHPAHWLYHMDCYCRDLTKRCSFAGPRRNQEMVDLGADLCLAFPMGESRGTRDCIRRAVAAGIPTYVTERL